MANETRQISILETLLDEREKLAKEYDDACLGNLTHNTIYKAGVVSVREALSQILTSRKGK